MFRISALVRVENHFNELIMPELSFAVAAIFGLGIVRPIVYFAGE